MACTEARLAANRANALKSTGPKTEAGKEASRRNALKHGLTGAGVVVPGEDAAEVERQSAAILVELAAGGLPTARLLAERVATLAVRLNRSARHELAATAERAHRAAIEFDEARRAEADRLFGAIDEGTNRDDLRAMPEGVDLLDAALAALHRAAAPGAAGWSRDDTAGLVRCLPAEARDHAEALGRALVEGDLAGLDPGIVAIMDPANVRGRWAVDQIVGLIEAERADLEALRPTLDHGAIGRARVEAVNLVLVDAEPETLLARKYEAATERSLYRALREIREIRRAAPAPSIPMPMPLPAMPPTAPPAPTPAEPVRQADATRRELARVEAAPVRPATAPLGSTFPAARAVPAAGPGATTDEVGPAPHGRSRFEDRRRRPRLDR